MNTEGTKRVCVFSSDRFLIQKIRLELYGSAEVCDHSTHRESDVCLVDVDDPRFCGMPGLSMSRNGDSDIKIPFPIGEVRQLLLFSEEKNRLDINHKEKCAVLDGKVIKLTELEYQLFKALMSKKGGYISREELMREVFENRDDKGILNVYIHYLREKLETNDEKIILSSRSCGYKINESYIGGESDA